MTTQSELDEVMRYQPGQHFNAMTDAWDDDSMHECRTGDYIRAEDHDRIVSSLQARIEAAEKDADAKQAKIYALMLEYCPDEMTEPQLEEWGKRQVAVAKSDCDAIKASIRDEHL